MGNLWEFLFQSLTISMIAAVILIIKFIFRDKLSTGWHYGIWGVLALRILVPVRGGRYIFFPIEIWLETLKGAIEGGMTSSYSRTFELMTIQFPFPVVSSRPVSITDWLFLIYVSGVVVALVRYFFNYLRLRSLLNHGEQISVENQQLIDAIAMKHELKTCKAVEVEGIPSAFVCGIIKPILVIPSDIEIDEKIILHELLHLRYKDAVQSTLWSILRSFHWCNPFFHYIFNRIENDMEILCDYRVLEKLQGEERRDYGNILLSMVNEKYPHAPGTTSISNGGKNIARRIISITRFKKYPKGMSLLSICISAILLQYFFLGTEATGIVFKEGYLQSRWDIHQAMASARVNRCTTIAGALDTYAKGILYNNGIYIATASPLGAHEELAERMMDNLKNKNTQYYYIDGELPGEASREAGIYAIYNLIETHNNTYRADIVFRVDDLFEHKIDDSKEPKEVFTTEGFIVYPVTITYEDSWVVTRDGEKKIYQAKVSDGIGFFWGNKTLPAVCIASGEGETGDVTISIQTIYHVHASLSSNDSDETNPESHTFYEKPILGATFAKGRMLTDYIYKYLGPEEEIEDVRYIGILKGELTDEQEAKDLGKWELDGRVTGWGEKFIDKKWDGILNSTEEAEIDLTNDKIGKIPSGYTIKVYFDADLREIITLKGGESIE